jgi:MoxR-like ATPase
MKRYLYEPKTGTITDIIAVKTITVSGKDYYELEKELAVASTMNVTYMTNEDLRQDVLDRYFSKYTEDEK